MISIICASPSSAKYSHWIGISTSVELAKALDDAPLRLGGLYDTLAHCYFAKQDYAAAVNLQTPFVEP